MNAKQLAALMREAAEAHHKFELSMQQSLKDDSWSDPDWASWYAHYMLPKIERMGLSVVGGE